MAPVSPARAQALARATGYGPATPKSATSTSPALKKKPPPEPAGSPHARRTMATGASPRKNVKDMTSAADKAKALGVRFNDEPSAALVEQQKSMAKKSLAVNRKKMQVGLDMEDDDYQLLKQKRSNCKDIERAFVTSNVFEIGTGLTILLAFAQQAYEVSGQASPSRVFWISFAENFITSFFLIEWFLRVHCYGCAYFKSVVNWIDTIIVWVIGVGVIWLWHPLTEFVFDYQPTSTILTIISVVRLVRLLRVISVVKHLPAMNDLWMLIKGVTSSASSFGAALFLIAFALFFFGLAAVELIGKAKYDGASALTKQNQEKFSGLRPSMFTLYGIMQGDDALSIIISLNEANPWIFIFFLIFVVCTTLILINLMTGIIVRYAFATSKEDDVELARQLKLKKERAMKDFIQIFREIDADGSGTVSLDEFVTAFNMPGIRSKLLKMGMTDAKLVQLFNLLDTDEIGELDLPEFYNGMTQLEGNAKGKDAVFLQKGLERLEIGTKELMQMREASMEKESNAIQEIKVATSNMSKNMMDTEENLTTLLEKMSQVGVAKEKELGKAKRKPPKKVGGPPAPITLPTDADASPSYFTPPR